MTDPSYYQTKFYLSERDARRAASYAMASISRGVRYNPKSVAVRAVLEGGRPWTSRATWGMAKIALRRKHWKYFSVTRAVGFGWWCRARMEGMIVTRALVTVMSKAGEQEQSHVTGVVDLALMTRRERTSLSCSATTFPETT